MSVHKFTVPDSDAIVEKWIANQSNPGVSIRMLINLFVTQHGYQDVTCMALGLAVKKRGRPSTQLKEKFEQFAEAMGTGAYDDYDGYDEETVQANDTVETVQAPVQRSVSIPASVRSKPVSVKPAEPAPKFVPDTEPANDPNDVMLNMFNSPPTSVSVGGNADNDDGDDGMDIDSLLG